MESKNKIVRQFLTTGSLLKVEFEKPFCHTDIISTELSGKQEFYVKEQTGRVLLLDPIFVEGQNEPDLSDIFAGSGFLKVAGAMTTEGDPVEPESTVEESLIETIVKDGKTIYKIKK